MNDWTTRIDTRFILSNSTDGDDTVLKKSFVVRSPPFFSIPEWTPSTLEHKIFSSGPAVNALLLLAKIQWSKPSLLSSIISTTDESSKYVRSWPVLNSFLDTAGFQSAAPTRVTRARTGNNNVDHFILKYGNGLPKQV
ncbi:hypothetical protein OGATHE_001350 [Ogataea polymorpha]|uniref:Uncharacterized protein n=1 Tax=Ogataea polymorpha TaxID=460523 RepID=A0A9P8PSN3_9ASCO|nr:hypothetical protein OGATHE_001350 [Ogataea polymorpha]